MDRRVNNSGSKGNKGGGRKSVFDESIRNAVISKSWDILQKFMDNKKSPEEEKRKIAVEIAKRSIPKEIDFKSKKILILDND